MREQDVTNTYKDVCRHIARLAYLRKQEKLTKKKLIPRKEQSIEEYLKQGGKIINITNDEMIIHNDFYLGLSWRETDRNNLDGFPIPPWFNNDKCHRDDR